MSKRTLSAVIAACILAAGGPARAQNAQDKASAEILFDEGKELMKQKKFSLACPKFLESNRLDTGLGTMLWLADCYDKNGQTASAWGEFREAADVAGRTRDPREKVARERSTRLEPLLSRMTIVVGASAVPGMVVKRDGSEVGQTSWGEPAPVDPGPHDLVVTAPGKKPWQTTVQLLRGVKNFQLTVPALEDAPLPPPPAPGAPQPAYTQEEEGPPPAVVAMHVRGTGQRIAGGLLTGFGVAAGGLGVVLHFYAQSEINTADTPTVNGGSGCNGQTISTSGSCGPGSTGSSELDSAKIAQTVQIVSFIGGGVLLVSGIALILAAPSGMVADPPKAASAISPWVGPGGGGLTLHW